ELMNSGRRRKRRRRRRTKPAGIRIQIRKKRRIHRHPRRNLSRATDSQVAVVEFGLLTERRRMAENVNPRVELEIVQDDQPLGTIVVELDAGRAPGSATNFLKYVDGGFYDGTIFHRVIPNFMVQGG